MADPCSSKDVKNRLGDCTVCGKEARYKCPACEVKTCSAECVKVHKEKFDCKGGTDNVQYQRIDNLTLLDDYKFLEETSRKLDDLNRDRRLKYTRYKRPLPPHLWKLRSTAMKRQITLHFLPQHFTRHKENTTKLNFKTGVIHWKLELIFPQADMAKISLEQCSENDRLASVLSQLIDYDKCPDVYKEDLRFYHACGLAGVEALLVAENVKGSDWFFLLDLSLTLRENFETKVIVEHPIIHVILRDHKDEYKVLDPDYDVRVNGDLAALRSLNFKRSRKIDGFSSRTPSAAEQAVESIHSSVAELKRYFVSGDSEESEEEVQEEEEKKKNCYGQYPIIEQRVKTGVLNIPSYEELVNKVDNM